MNAEFERSIVELTRPLNGQLPRPWMTTLRDPCAADTFVVGRNQRNGYRLEEVGSHERHLDALFNRNGQSCRQLYDEITGGKSSPTRQHIDGFARQLEQAGVRRILETNVICYSTPMSADLRARFNTGGAARGEEIFRFLLAAIKPKAIVVHGAGASRQLGRILAADLGPEPESAGDLRSSIHEGMLVVVIRSLAPPGLQQVVALGARTPGPGMPGSRRSSQMNSGATGKSTCMMHINTADVIVQTCC